MHNKTIKYVLLIVALALITFYVVENFETLLDIFGDLKLENIIVLTMLLYVIFLASGIKIMLITLILSDIKISSYDVFTLPLAMSFAGYAFPIKGGSIYQTIHLKNKYNITWSKSILNTLLNQGITIIILIYPVLFISDFFSLSTILCSMLSPVIFWYLLKSKKIDSLLSMSSYLMRLKRLLLKLLSTTKKNLRLICYLFLVSLIKLIIESLWFLHASQSLDLIMSLRESYMFSIIKNLSALMKVIPGNIGINEFIAEQYSSVISKKENFGFSLMILLRIISIGITVTLGTLFFYKNKLFSYK